MEYLLTLLLLLFVLIFLLQTIATLAAYNVLRYASFMAARSYAVYGKRTLRSIDYPVRSAAERNVTDPTQTIAEATAERVLADGLFWEAWRVKPGGLILDGIDDDIHTDSVLGKGSFRIEFLGDKGVKVAYCMPTLWQWLPKAAQGPNSCEDTRQQVRGFLLTATSELGLEPGAGQEPSS